MTNFGSASASQCVEPDAVRMTRRWCRAGALHAVRPALRGAALTCVSVAVATLAACGSGAGPVKAGPPSRSASGTLGSISATPLSPSAVPPLSGESGEKLVLGSDIGTAYEVSITVDIATHPVAGDTLSVDASEYEVALVTIHGESGSYSFDPADFEFVDASARHYLPLEGLAADRFGGFLGTGTVTAGQEVEGHLVFEVPPGGGAVQLKDSLGRPMAWRARS